MKRSAIRRKCRPSGRFNGSKRGNRAGTKLLLWRSIQPTWLLKLMPKEGGLRSGYQRKRLRVHGGAVMDGEHHLDDVSELSK